MIKKSYLPLFILSRHNQFPLYLIHKHFHNRLGKKRVGEIARKVRFIKKEGEGEDKGVCNLPL